MLINIQNFGPISNFDFQYLKNPYSTAIQLVLERKERPLLQSDIGVFKIVYPYYFFLKSEMRPTFTISLAFRQSNTWYLCYGRCPSTRQHKISMFHPQNRSIHAKIRPISLFLAGLFPRLGAAFAVHSAPVAAHPWMAREAADGESVDASRTRTHPQSVPVQVRTRTDQEGRRLHAARRTDRQ